MNLLSPVMRLEVGGTEVFHRVRGPVVLVAPRTAEVDLTVIAAALPALRRWRLRWVNGDDPVQRAQLAAGNNLLVLADLTEPWVGELLTSVQVPVIPVGVRGSYAVGGWRDVVRRRLQRTDDRPRVAVRFGEPLQLPTDPAAAVEVVTAACQRLVAEDETTWWQSLRANPAADQAPPAGGWRSLWERTGPMPRGGPVTRRRIWE